MKDNLKDKIDNAKNGDLIGITMEEMKDIDKMLRDDFEKKFPKNLQPCPHCGTCPTCGRQLWPTPHGPQPCPPKPMWEWKPGVYYSNGFTCAID